MSTWSNHAGLLALGMMLSLSFSQTFAGDGETKVLADAIAHRDLTYAERPTGPVKLDLYTPPGNGLFPLVVWIHGGAWKLGNKAEWPHMNFLVAEGFAVANVEYRFSQVAPFPAQIDDCAAALDFLVAHAGEYQLDPNRIAVTGESAGGHLALLLGMQHSAGNATEATPIARSTSKVRAIIDLFGPTNLVAHVSGGPDRRQTVEQLLGGTFESHEDLARQASPLTYVSKEIPPVLIFHGTKDPLVPFDQTAHFVDALKNAGAKVEFHPVQGVGHAGPAFWTMSQRAIMVKFLQANLLGKLSE